MGVRKNRYAVAVDDGVVTGVYVEASGKYEASSAEAILCRPLSGCDITANSHLNRIGRSRYCGQRNGRLIVNRNYCAL